MKPNKKEVLIVLFFLIMPLVFSIDSDRDGIPDEKDSHPNDFDNDGMPDSWELRNGLRPDIFDSKNDPDNDGFSNLEEYQRGTDPNSQDSDCDSVSDFVEVKERKTEPLVEESIVWPLVVVPVLIILFVVLLYLFERFHLGLIMKDRWEKYTQRKQAPLERKTNDYIEYGKPDIRFKGLKEIRKDFGRDNRHYFLNKCGSETFVPKENNLDFAFTSPPYFNWEQYGEEDGQSFKQYDGAEAWNNGFLRKTIQNAYIGLKKVDIWG